jgi:hypothetical protein
MIPKAILDFEHIRILFDSSINDNGGYKGLHRK